MQGRNVFLAGLFGVGRGDCVNLVAQPVLHATECLLPITSSRMSSTRVKSCCL